MLRPLIVGLTAFSALALSGCASLGGQRESAGSGAAQPTPVFRPASVEQLTTPRPALASNATPTPTPSVTATSELASELASAGRTESTPSAARTLPSGRDVPVAYVALGDSTVEGIGATSPEKNYVGRIFTRLKDQYPAAKVDNLGVAGATSADVALQQLPKAVALRPTLVTLSVGPNDITQGRDIDEYARNVDAILGTLARDTDAVVVVNTLPDLAVSPIFRSEEKQIVGALSRAYNDILVEKARQYGAEVVELYAPSQDEVPANTSLFAADNYHPSDAGYARWAEFMWRGVEARLGERAEARG